MSASDWLNWSKVSNQPITSWSFKTGFHSLFDDFWQLPDFPRILSFMNSSHLLQDYQSFRELKQKIYIHRMFSDEKLNHRTCQIMLQLINQTESIKQFYTCYIWKGYICFSFTGFSDPLPIILLLNPIFVMYYQLHYFYV